MMGEDEVDGDKPLSHAVECTLVLFHLYLAVNLLAASMYLALASALDKPA